MIIFLRPFKLLKCISHHTGSGKDRGLRSSGRWSPSPDGPLKAQVPFRPRREITGWVGGDGDVEELGFLLDIFRAKLRSADMKSYLSSKYTDLFCPLWKVIYSSVQANIWLSSSCVALKLTKAASLWERTRQVKDCVGLEEMMSH